MKYFTATGKIIEGDTPLEVLESLRTSSEMDAGLDMGRFLEVLRLRINMYRGSKGDGLGHVQLLSELEDVGLHLRMK